jgi:hypothetical protein
MRPTKYHTRIIMTALFGMAMAFFEAAVVVYLRELYYPHGFSFPLRLIPLRLIYIELFREAATIIMLTVVAGLAGKKFWERFGYFIILFGVWDIFYYIWLKITVNWPSSLLEYDILFLIPLPWVGPVIAPVLVAILMVVFGFLITVLYARGYTFKPTAFTWTLSIAATTILLYSFMRDTDATLRQQMPHDYPYILLIAGLLLYMVAFWNSYIRAKKE